MGCMVAKSSKATEQPITTPCRYAAAVKESPMPVASAKYMAKQAGHFGTSASTTLGTIMRTIVE